MKNVSLWKWELRFALKAEWDQCVDMEIDFGNYLTGEVRRILEDRGCHHGHNLSSTPPMFYPEALICALHHQRSEGSRLQRMSRALSDIAAFSRQL